MEESSSQITTAIVAVQQMTNQKATLTVMLRLKEAINFRRSMMDPFLFPVFMGKTYCFGGRLLHIQDQKSRDGFPGFF